MNWNDPETDELLKTAAAATTDEARAEAYGKVLLKVQEAVTWLPIYERPMQIAYVSKLQPITPHNIYGAGLYKGLQLEFK